MKSKRDRYAEKAVSERENMIFYLSILSQAQKQDTNLEISKLPQLLEQGLPTHEQQVKLREIQQKTRAKYFLEQRLFS